MILNNRLHVELSLVSSRVRTHSAHQIMNKSIELKIVTLFQVLLVSIDSFVVEALVAPTFDQIIMKMHVSNQVTSSFRQNDSVLAILS